MCAFWDMYELGSAAGSGRREAWAACEPAAARGEPFKLHGVSRRGAGVPGASPPPRFTLKFRPAAPEDGAAALAGGAMHARGRPYFFVELEPDAGWAPRSLPCTPTAASGLRRGASGLRGVGSGLGFGCGGGEGADGGVAGGSPRGAGCGSPVGSDTGSAGTLASVSSMPFPGLEMGKLLGRGAFGFVYRGTYQGTTVAVKARALGLLGSPLLA